MVRLRIILLALLLAVLGAGPSDRPCTDTELLGLPNWFRGADPLPTGVRVSCYLNPFYQRGDFDADGRPDLAVLVVQAASGKRGVAVVHRESLKASILGAGVPFGNGGDDFSWLDVWVVVPAPTRPSPYEEKVPPFRGEGLSLVKLASASGFVGWVGDRYVWFQTSD
jgi:hypothetical protein